MKKLILALCVLILSVSVFAQDDVTKFLGIPIDGFKPEMIRKLKGKGFTDHPYKSDVLVGEFNGRDVEVSVVTNNNKVYRIFLQDRYSVSEMDIKIRFNTLCRQFEGNSNYISISEQIIPEDEDISYEMSVSAKRYEAVFYQQPEKLDTLASQQTLFDKVRAKYTEEQLANPTEEMQQDFVEMSLEIAFDIVSTKSVWFMIDKDGSESRILMYYDNKKNQANGQDL